MGVVTGSVCLQVVLRALLLCLKLHTHSYFTLWVHVHVCSFVVKECFEYSCYLWLYDVSIHSVTDAVLFLAGCGTVQLLVNK